MKKLIPLLALSMAFTTLSVQAADAPAVLVCRARQCAATSYSMTSGYLYNKLVQLMEKNTNKTVLVCEADPVSHVCLSEGIHIPAKTPFAPVGLTIENLQLTDTKLVNGQNSMDVIFDYKLRANQTYPECQLGISHLCVPFVDKVELLTDDFSCNFVDSGKTTINATYSVDYLDFDYGFIGAYYTIGVGESVQGEKSGYALMRFTDKTPLSTQDRMDPAMEQNTQNTALPPAVPPKMPNPQPYVGAELPPPPTDMPDPRIIQPTEPAPIIPKSVKTTIVEKTVITSETPSRNVVIPEKRTILEDVAR